MKSFIIVLVLLLISFQLYCQKEVNYQHKILFKEINKKWGIKNPNIKEIDLPDSVIIKNNLNGKFFKVANEYDDTFVGYAYIGRVNSCRESGCSADREPIEQGNYEFFDYFILFDKNISINSVRVYNYHASHGQEITAKSWLKQFENHNGTKNLEVGKNIDAISGATISVYAITFDISYILENIHEYIVL